MPSGDRTGPLGAGPMTGRGAGLCGGAGGGRGFWGRGFGRGGGRGWRNWFLTTGVPGWMRFGFDARGGDAGAQTDEDSVLRGRAEMLERELDAIRRRLDATKPRGEL